MTIIRGLIPYDTRSEEIPEKIAPGAFTFGEDVLLCYAHDTKQVLARTLNKSLVIKNSPTALLWEAELHPDKIQLHKDVLGQLELGLSYACSFGFKCLQDDYRNGERILMKVQLNEISIVPRPCYRKALVKIYDKDAAYQIASNQRQRELQLLEKQMSIQHSITERTRK